MFKKILVTLTIATLVAAAVLTTLVVKNGFPFQYMDLNDSGFVSVGEAIRTLELGVVERNNAGQTCVEIFALKDAMPVKLVCNDS